MSESVELSHDAYDILLGYQRDGETLAETLHRVVVPFVPHPNRLAESGIDPKMVGRNTRVIVERWPDEDGYVDTRVFRRISAYLEATEPVIEAHYPEVRIEREIAEADITAEEILEELEARVEDGE